MFVCICFVCVVSNFLISFQCSAGTISGMNVLRIINRSKTSALLARPCLSESAPEHVLDGQLGPSRLRIFKQAQPESLDVHQTSCCSCPTTEKMELQGFNASLCICFVCCVCCWTSVIGRRFEQLTLHVFAGFVRHAC